MSITKQWFAGASADDLLAVATLESIGSNSWQKLYASFDSLSAVLKSNQKSLMAAGLTEYQASCLHARPQQVASARRLLSSKNIEIVTIDSRQYPSLLRKIDDPPLWLFCRGNLSVLKSPCLTVIGARQPSDYALAALEKLLPEALIRKVCLTSGLEYGIDKEVHQRALKLQGETIAVLAGGLDSIYPAEHHRLAEEIMKCGGLLISEYPPLSRPQPTKFLTRNRIIAGLSRLTVVVEAAIRSGSLAIATAAIRYNRDIMAVPCDITRGDAKGANFLIKMGAVLLDDPTQLLRYFGLNHEKKEHKLDTPDGKLLNLLAKQSMSVDQIAKLTKRSIPSILGILTELELLGQVFQSSPGLYRAKK